MLNTENSLPVWIFFSNVDAITVNNSASQLLAWSGESFGRLFGSTQNLLNVLLDGNQGVVYRLHHDPLPQSCRTAGGINES